MNGNVTRTENGLLSRPADAFIALVFIIILAPLMLLVAALVAVTCGRPMCERVRLPDAAGTAMRFRLDGDGPVVRLLTRCRADELPILFAVLDGTLRLRAWGTTPEPAERVGAVDAA